jgi:glucosamine-phosphate N-acetyltransferase
MTNEAFSSAGPVTTIQVKTTATIDPVDEVGLFTSDLISPEIAASLPETYSIRSLQKSDYARGFLDVLRVLTTVGDISEEAWNERYDWMNTQGKGGYYLLCILDGERVVGTGALIVERKL